MFKNLNGTSLPSIILTLQMAALAAGEKVKKS
jgi:hypothetical protein